MKSRARSHGDGLVVGVLLVALGATIPSMSPTWVLAQSQPNLLDPEEEPVAKPAAAPPSPAAAGSPGPAPGKSSPLDQEEEPGGAVPKPAGSTPPAPLRTPVGGGVPGRSVLDPLSGADEEALEVEEVCDVLLYQVGQGIEEARIRLIPDRLPDPIPPRATFEFSRLRSGEKAKEDGKYKKEWLLELPGSEIRGVAYYEDRMLRRVAETLKVPLAGLRESTEKVKPDGPESASRVHRAIRLLTQVIREHDSARARLQRRGESWNGLRLELANLLLNLRLRQVDELLTQRKNQEASTAMDQLRAAPELGELGRVVFRQRFEDLILTPAMAALGKGDFDTVRFALEEFQNRYPFDQGEKSRKLREGLVAAATKLVDRARAEKNPRWLLDAQKIWPHLSGMDDVRREIVQGYPRLRCAYPALPRHFSPLTARTPADGHAVALLYDRLVRWTSDDVAGPHYVSQLATHRPLPQSRGREFELPRIEWSDSDGSQPHYCTAEDVRWTVRLLKKLRPPGYSLSWEVLFDDVRDLERADPFRVDLRLHRDYWQPLSLMDFPILPKASFPSLGERPEELEQFERMPIGTGPFRLATEQSVPNAVRFVANPLYRMHGLPLIREIVMEQYESVEAFDEFGKGNVDLVYGVRKEHVVLLRKNGKRVERLPARGVHFLAPNYRRPSLQNRDLRLAIAHAIDREAILRAHFRPGGAGQEHAALNGPFLVNTWPFNPRVPPYSTPVAKTHAAEAMKALGAGSPPLSLVYPELDPDAAAACSEIQRQCQAVGVQLVIDAVSPDQFHDRITRDQNFDLAYWRHDYKDESYWLWPLLNPAEKMPGGSNFMGYTPSEDLEKLFGVLATHKMFRKIQETSRQLHEWIHRDAVVIPLWQLDTYVAVSEEVQDARFSPTELFSNIESWRLEAR